MSKTNIRFFSTCIDCLVTETVTVPMTQYIHYQAGALVQNAFPDLTPAERDIIIGSRNGERHLCGRCF